jgi:hypothetical protein
LSRYFYTPSTRRRLIQITTRRDDPDPILYSGQPGIAAAAQETTNLPCDVIVVNEQGVLLQLGYPAPAYSTAVLLAP